MRDEDFSHECCFTPRSLLPLVIMAGWDLEVQAGGPAPLGVVSAGRWLLWGLISCYYPFLNLVETGKAGDGIFTRVFQCRAVKVDREGRIASSA
jgi:hypothetical protein